MHADAIALLSAAADLTAARAARLAGHPHSARLERAGAAIRRAGERLAAADPADTGAVLKALRALGICRRRDGRLVDPAGVDLGPRLRAAMAAAQPLAGLSGVMAGLGFRPEAALRIGSGRP